MELFRCEIKEISMTEETENMQLETPPRRKKSTRRRRNRKKRKNKLNLDRAAESGFKLVPRGVEPSESLQQDLLNSSLPFNGAGFLAPGLGIYPFGAPGAFPDIAPGMPMEIGGTTFYNSTAPVSPEFDPISLLPSHDPVAIMKQVEWYFQPANLEKDYFLRQNMDSRGYVDADILANFNRLSAHGITSTEIVTCCRASTVVKVKDGKIKPRNNWFMWVIPNEKVTRIEASDEEDESEVVLTEAATQSVDLTPPSGVNPQMFTATQLFNMFPTQPQVNLSA